MAVRTFCRAELSPFFWVSASFPVRDNSAGRPFSYFLAKLFGTRREVSGDASGFAWVSPLLRMTNHGKNKAAPSFCKGTGRKKKGPHHHHRTHSIELSFLLQYLENVRS